MIPIARVYVSVGRVINGLGSSAFACRLERALQAVAANETATEGLLLGLGAVALCFLLGYAIFVLIYCQVGFFSMGLF